MPDPVPNPVNDPVDELRDPLAPRPASRAARLFAATIGPKPAEEFGAQFAQTLRRTVWFLPCEWLLIGLLAAVGLSVGNAGSEEVDSMMDQGLVYFLAVGAVIAPVIEELCFRGLPSVLSDWFLGRSDARRWPLGIASALVFAALHNVVSKPGEHTLELTPEAWFDLRTIPLPQFAFGLLLWDLVRRYGLWAASFSHMLHNLVVLSLGYATSRPS